MIRFMKKNIFAVAIFTSGSLAIIFSNGATQFSQIFTLKSKKIITLADGGTGSGGGNTGSGGNGQHNGGNGGSGKP